jgi:hypothetical protein
MYPYEVRVLMPSQDQVDHVANLSDAQADIFIDVSILHLPQTPWSFSCETLGQIRELYRERVALERDYAAKMLALAQKNVDKKNKKMARAVVGDEPFKQWNEETLLQRWGCLYSHLFAACLTYGF